jgi:hypothetical protein
MTPQIQRTAEAPWWTEIRWVFLAALGLLIVVGLTLRVVRKLVPITVRACSSVFQHAATGWVEAARPTGAVWQLRVTRGGTVWAQTWIPSGLSRLEGGSWKQHGGDQCRVFAVDGEQVWYATSSFVAHFDGQHWRWWREAVVTPDAASIVAAKGEAWVVDEAGNLSHYAGGT